MSLFGRYEKKVHACGYPGRSGWYLYRVPVRGDIWRCWCGKRWEYRDADYTGRPRFFGMQEES